MPPTARSLPRARIRLALVATVAAAVLAVACARDAPTGTTDGTPVLPPATTAGTTGGSALGTVAPMTAPPSSTATSSTTAPATTAAPTSTAGPVATAGVVRGLPITTSTVTYIDGGRATVSHGRTIAATRTLATTIVRPTSGGPYPLVVFAHGFQLGPANYQHLLGVIASAGYVVAAPSFPLADASVAGGNLDRGDLPNQSGDLSFVIDQIVSGPLAASVDRSRIGAVGHSDGADTVLDIGYQPQRRDPRVRAVVALSPDAMTGAVVGGAPLLIVHGDRDSIVPYSNATTVFAQVPSHRYLVTLTGADHLPPVQGAQPWSAVVDAAVLDLLDARVAERGHGEAAIVRDATVGGVAAVKAAG